MTSYNHLELLFEANRRPHRVKKKQSFVVIMRIIFLLTALVGLLLLSITLNALREGKIFRPLKKRLGGLSFSSTEKYFPGSLQHNFYYENQTFPSFFHPTLYNMDNFMGHLPIA